MDFISKRYSINNHSGIQRQRRAEINFITSPVGDCFCLLAYWNECCSVIHHFFFGELAQAMEWINNEEWILPKWWPGDNTGGNQLFPDALTAGREMYRAMYTVYPMLDLMVNTVYII